MILEYAVYKQYNESLTVLQATFRELEEAKAYVDRRRKLFKKMNTGNNSKFYICTKENVENRTFKRMEF